MDDRLVGTLALTANHKVAFSYSEEWLEHGFSVSPFSLPLKNEVFVPKKDYFDGLFGVFADSLPDAWGQLLLERLLKERGKKEAQYSVLDRLAIVGKSGMGALTYHPQKEIGMGQQMDDLDELSVSNAPHRFPPLEKWQPMLSGKSRRCRCSPSERSSAAEIIRPLSMPSITLKQG